MKYRVRLHCPDCLGEDYEGCFGGGYETDEEEYDTYEEAANVGCESTSSSIWEFDVVNENGFVVPDPLVEKS